MRVDCVEWGGSLRKDINEVLAKDGAFALGEMFGNVVPITEATEAPPTIDAQIDAVLDEINDNNALIKTFGDAEYLEKGRQLSVKEKRIY